MNRSFDLLVVTVSGGAVVAAANVVAVSFAEPAENDRRHRFAGVAALDRRREPPDAAPSAVDGGGSC